LIRVILGDPERFDFLKKEQVAKSCPVGREAVAIASFSVLLAADLVDPMVGIVDTTCVACDMAVHVASASAIVATTSSFASAVGGASAAAAAASTTAATLLVVAAL
jgi:hypothetical protein